MIQGRDPNTHKHTHDHDVVDHLAQRLLVTFIVKTFYRVQ